MLLPFRYCSLESYVGDSANHCGASVADQDGRTPLHCASMEPTIERYELPIGSSSGGNLGVCVASTMATDSCGNVGVLFEFCGRSQ